MQEATSTQKRSEVAAEKAECKGEPYIRHATTRAAQRVPTVGVDLTLTGARLKTQCQIRAAPFLMSAASSFESLHAIIPACIVALDGLAVAIDSFESGIRIISDFTSEHDS